MTLLLILAALALIAAGSTARLAYEHHAVRATVLAVVWLAAPGHGPHSRPISWPHPLRQRHRGMRRAIPEPRHAREAAAA
jgi:hypothetical protein